MQASLFNGFLFEVVTGDPSQLKQIEEANVACFVSNACLEQVTQFKFPPLAIREAESCIGPVFAVGRISVA